MSILMSNTLFKNFSAKYLMLLLTELFRLFILRFESSWPNILNYGNIYLNISFYKAFVIKHLMLLLTELFRVFILRFESSWPNLLNYDKSDLKEKIKAFLDLISIVVKLMVIFYIASFFYRMVENSVNMDSEYSSLTYGWFLIKSDFYIAYNFFLKCKLSILKMTPFGSRSSDIGGSGPGSNSNNPEPRGPNGPKRPEGPINTGSSHENNDESKRSDGVRSNRRWKKRPGVFALDKELSHEEVKNQNGKRDFLDLSDSGQDNLNTKANNIEVWKKTKKS